MPEETAPELGADIGSVRVTIATASGPGRPPPARRVRMRVPVIAMMAMVAAVAAVAVIAPQGGRRVRAPAVARAMRSAGAPAQLGAGLRCPRLVMVAPGGAFARVDVDAFTPCGTYGNYATIVFQRVRGRWVRVLAMSAQMCAWHPLPRRVLTELGLCLRGQEHTPRM